MNARPTRPRSPALFFWALFLSCLRADMTPTAPAPDLLAEALPILQSHYVDFSDLQVQPTDRLADLVTRSHGEISLGVAVPPTTNPAPSILPVLLPDEMVYCRLASFAPASDAFVAQLKTWQEQGAQGVILDLRSNSAPNDFQGAARVAGLFTTPGTPLFSIKDVGQDSRAYKSAALPLLITSPVAVLINNQTSGAAEALAACLKAHGALTLGRWSSGNGAEFEDHPLASGQVLHYVVGQVTMADGTALWRHSIEPDIGLMIDPKKEEKVLGLIAQNRILDVIHESSGSHRLSEAALVRGEDPGVEAYLVPHAKPVPGAVPAPQDSTLIAALDSLKAIRVSQGAPAAAPLVAPSTVQ